MRLLVLTACVLLGCVTPLPVIELQKPDIIEIEIPVPVMAPFDCTCQCQPHKTLEIEVEESKEDPFLYNPYR